MDDGHKPTISPESIDKWLTLDLQHSYVAKFKGQVGFTRRRAECFVRLWAYLWLKQQLSLGIVPKFPLDRLGLPQGFVSCTHRETAELFYAHQERGSNRAAGMMLDKLVDLGYLEKQFDGNTICLKIGSLPLLEDSPTPEESVQFVLDDFNPRTDAIPVASFLTPNYSWMNLNTTVLPQRIARVLRQWARQYPKGMRVLRRSDNLNPVGFYIFYPTAQESEENFFLPPSKSLHLPSNQETDPIQIALPGDRNCTSIFVRSWMLDREYMQTPQVCQLLEDSQHRLRQMQEDFPHLCDLYALIVHPIYEELTAALGFHKTLQGSMSSICWKYLAIDRFLALDIPQAISGLTFS